MNNRLQEIIDNPNIVLGVIGTVQGKNLEDIKKIKREIEFAIPNPIFLYHDKIKDSVRITEFSEEKNKLILILELDTTDDIDNIILNKLGIIGKLNSAIKTGTIEDIREIKLEKKTILTSILEELKEKPVKKRKNKYSKNIKGKFL